MRFTLNFVSNLQRISFKMSNLFIQCFESVLLKKTANSCFHFDLMRKKRHLEMLVILSYDFVSIQCYRFPQNVYLSISIMRQSHFFSSHFSYLKFTN